MPNVGPFQKGVCVWRDDPDLIEVVIFDLPAVTMYSRRSDEALWCVSIKTGLPDGEGWVAVTDVTYEDPMYWTLSAIVESAHALSIGSEGKHVHDGRGADRGPTFPGPIPESRSGPARVGD